MMRSLVTWSLKFRVPVVVVAAALIGLGVRQLRTIPVDVLPEFSPPLVEIQTEALGLSAQEVEQLITVPLEQDLLNGVPWLHTIGSESLTGLSSILLVFKPGTDLMRARQMVSERLTQAFALPHVSKPPTMLQPMSSTSRIMLIGLSSKDLSLIQMSVLARWTIAPRLLGVPGVANVAIWGQRDRQLQVLADPERLRNRGVSLLQVLETTGNALWVSSLSFVEASTPGTGGFIDNANQRLGIRHILPIVSPEGLAQVPIAATGVRLGDVADVVEGHQPLIGDALTGDQSSLLLVVDRFPGTNLRDVTRGVNQALTELRPGLSGLEMSSTLFQPAAFVETSISNVGWAALVGFGLVVLVLAFFFFDWRSVVIGTTAIALSMVVGGLVLALRGVTVNVMIVAGFFMAIGVVVDDAITHVDTIGRRLRQSRQGGGGSAPSALTVILGAVAELRSATVFATLILLLAVAPMFVLGGLPGAFWEPLAVSYGLAVLASMIVALTVTPALCLILIARASADRAAPPVLRLRQAYERGLTRMIARPGMALLTLAVLLVAGVATLPILRRSAQLKFAERDLVIQLSSVPGTSQPEMSRISSRVSHELRSIPGVTDVGAHVGRAIFGDQVVDVNSAEVWVSIARSADYDRTVADIRNVVQGYPGLHPHVRTYLGERRDVLLGRSNDSIVVRVYGDADQLLARAAADVKTAIAGIQGVAGARINSPVQQPTMEIEVNMSAAQRYGIKPGDVRRAAATMFSGLQVGNLFEEQKVFDVVVWGMPATRHSLRSVNDLLIDTPSGTRVRLGDVAHVRVVSSPNVIRHEAVKRYVDVLAGVRGREISAVAADIESRLLQVPMPLEYHAEVLGAYADRHAAEQRMLALSVGVLLGILLLLQAALGSWRLAGLAYVTLIATLAGGLIAALGAGRVISLGSLVGFLALFGIAARNAILLMKRYRDLQLRDGAAFGSALAMQGASERFVPILMTAFAAAAALLPAWFLGDRNGLEIVHPMAVVLVGGLVTSTLVNLFVLPTLYVAAGVAAAPDMDLAGPEGLSEAAAMSGAD